MSNATDKNIMAIKQHSEQTRILVREVELKTTRIDTMSEQITLLQKQVGLIQTKLYSGGATDGD